MIGTEIERLAAFDKLQRVLEKQHWTLSVDVDGSRLLLIPTSFLNSRTTLEFTDLNCLICWYDGFSQAKKEAEIKFGTEDN